MLIGLMGPIGVGKTTISKAILEYDSTYIKKSFSEPIKTIAKSFGFTHCNGTTEEKEIIDPDWGISARTFMQQFGTTVCRNNLKKLIPNMNVDDNVFVSIMKKKIIDEFNSNNSVIIDDVRFPNEAEMIKSLGGIIVLVDCVDYVDYKINSHESESYYKVITPDYIIKNESDLIDIINKLNVR